MLPERRIGPTDRLEEHLHLSELPFLNEEGKYRLSNATLDEHRQALRASSQSAAATRIAQRIRRVNSTYAATANSPAIRQTFFIDQVTDSVIVVVFFLKAVADVYIGRAGNAHGSSAFRLLWTILARAMDLVAVRKYAALLERCI